MIKPSESPRFQGIIIPEEISRSEFEWCNYFIKYVHIFQFDPILSAYFFSCFSPVYEKSVTPDESFVTKSESMCFRFHIKFNVAALL